MTGWWLSLPKPPARHFDRLNDRLVAEHFGKLNDHLPKPPARHFDKLNDRLSKPAEANL